MQPKLSSLTAAALAAGLVLLPTTTALAQESAVGTATNRLLGAHLEVGGLGVVPDVDVLDITTLATTNPADALNGVTGPFAQTSIVPLRVGQDAIGAITASSDGTSSGQTPVSTTGGPLDALGVDVSPISTTAVAGADSATAIIDVAVAEVTALLGQLGLDIDVTGVTSLVGPTGATSVQGLRVGALDVDLDSLGLGADVLGQLPLGDLLALLDALPLDDLPVDLDATVAAVLDGLDGLDAALADVDTVSALAESYALDLAVLDGLAGDLTGLDALLGTLSALEGGDATSILNGLTGVSGDLDALSCGISLPTLVDLLLEADPLAVVTALLDDAVACVEGEIATVMTDGGADGIPALSGVAAADSLTAVTDLIDSLTTGLPVQVGLIEDAIAAVESIIADLTGGVGGLDDLLAALTGLLDDIADAPLLSIGAFSVGTSTVATDSLDTSSASVLCEALDVAVLGTVFSTPDCSDGLGQLNGVTALISDAVGEVVALLNSLPISDLLSVSDLRLDVFSGLTENVTKTGDQVVATAGLNLLDLELPSITLDPSAIADDLIGGLELPDVLGLIGGDLTDLDAALAPVAALPGIGDVVTQVSGITSALGDVDGLTDQLGVVTGLLDGLDLGLLGSLAEPISTPTLALLIDPVSTSSFTPAAAGSGSGTPAPTPTPDTSPELPTTGGGLALLGVLATGGAMSLRRRRQ